MLKFSWKLCHKFRDKLSIFFPSSVAWLGERKAHLSAMIISCGIVLTVSKTLLETAGMHVSEVVDETNQVAHEQVRTRIIAAADKMLKDYQTIEGILKKHGV